MISTRTTIVTGAGASQPYGFPLGGDLVDEAKKLEPGNELTQGLYHRHGVRDINRWLGELRNSPVRSLDKFIQDRHDFPTDQAIGRSVIAALMGEHILRANYNDATDNWIEQLAHEMCIGVRNPQEFAEKNTGLQIITFNFEQVIEGRLFANIRRRYPRDGLNLREIITGTPWLTAIRRSGTFGSTKRRQPFGSFTTRMST